MEKGGNYYEFFLNTRLVKPTILHFRFVDIQGLCGFLVIYLKLIVSM